jgi:hypothetical protein
MINIITWMRGTKYPDIYVERLYQGVKRNLNQPFRFLLITDREPDLGVSEPIEQHPLPNPELTRIKGCFARLRMFDPVWQQGCKLAGKCVCLDLDLIVTGSLDSVFDWFESLVLLGGANAANPCPFNCSVMMFTTYTHADLWEEFSIDVLPKVPRYEFPDDQGWIWFKKPQAATWQAGEKSGVYAFKKPGWPSGDALPSDARIVAFPGHRDPKDFAHLPWIREHWLLPEERK